MSAHPLSVQLYTVREAIAHDPAAALDRIAAVGFSSVELCGMLDMFDAYEEHLPRVGLTPSSAHASLVGCDIAPLLDAARRLGVTTLIEPLVPAELWTGPDAIAGIARDLNTAARSAAAVGITVGYHNHWWELRDIGGISALELLAESLDPEVVLEVDTYWAQVGGVDAVGLLERLGERVQFIHVKDGDISLNNAAQVAVGSGRMPIAEVLAAAPQAVRVVELDSFDGDVFDALADSITFLCATGESL